jgi:hypothetical protein
MKIFLILTIIISGIILVMYLATPKNSGYSAIVGQHFKSCKCFGINVTTPSGEVMATTCYGIVFGCEYIN